VELLQWALPRLQLRWPGFRKVRGQVCKRIARRITELDLESAADYRARLDSDPAEWVVLDALCRVTIARFFRDRLVWERMRDEVLPAAARAAARAGADVRCWSAGCASGEEPYGISILFRLAIAPAFPGVGLRVVATDVEDAVLDRATTACYEPAALRRLPGWAAGAFEPRHDLLCLRPEFRADVELRREDLGGADDGEHAPAWHIERDILQDQRLAEPGSQLLHLQLRRRRRGSGGSVFGPAASGLLGRAREGASRAVSHAAPRRRFRMSRPTTPAMSVIPPVPARSSCQAQATSSRSLPGSTSSPISRPAGSAST
jgi:chemotaxis protein methyltransferase CheR